MKLRKITFSNKNVFLCWCFVYCKGCVNCFKLFWSSFNTSVEQFVVYFSVYLDPNALFAKNVSEMNWINRRRFCCMSLEVPRNFTLCHFGKQKCSFF